MTATFSDDLFRQYIHQSRYARWLPEQNRRETWDETVDRYFAFFDTHLKTASDYTIPKALRAKLRAAVYNQEVMPSMRALMTAGPALERDNVAGYNCAYLTIDKPTSFDEILYILMCLSPDTLIKTKNGDKKISDITPEDQVLSLDESNGKYEYVTPEDVTETLSSEKDKIELQLENGHVIRCTADHKFLTTNRGWVKATELTENDDIKNYHEVK